MQEIREGTYIKKKRNIIFVGKTGTGKTHLATALGLEACRQGKVLPILFRNEDRYAMHYGTIGRPNFSVARLLGLCPLQERNDLGDQETLDTFSFDARWRYTLDIADDKEDLSFPLLPRRVPQTACRF